MGLKDKMIKKAAEIEERRPRFTPLELNEGNVQAIFNRCLAKEDSKDVVSALIASTVTGFQESDIKIISFDKDTLIANRKNIEYLYGQLKCVHAPARRIPLSDFFLSYLSYAWTSDKATLEKLLYLGSSYECQLLDIFEASDMTTSFMRDIRLSLSPKDPNFPAWWEAHKGEWEQ